MARLETKRTEAASGPGSGSVSGAPRESRVIPSLLLTILAAAAMWRGTRPISDQSAFLHLSIARQLVHGDGFGLPDPWISHTTYAYVATEWLPALAAYEIESVVGLAGIAWLLCLGILACLAVTFWAARRVADTVPALLVTGTFLVAASHALTPRPQLLGLILLGVTVAAWWRSAEDLRARWWLVPVTWLGACSHGLWLLGVGIGVVTVGGLALDRRLSWPAARRLLAVPLASLAAAAVTPLGPTLLLTPFTVSSRVHDFVGEWQATSAHDLAAMVTLAMLGLVVLGLSRSRSRLPWWQVVHLALAVVLTLTMERTVAVGAVLAVPLMAQTLQLWRGVPATSPGRRAGRAVLAGVVALGLVAVPLTAATASEPAGVPSVLSSRLSQLPAGTTVLEDANISAWVRWTHPSLLAVLDSRSEIYSRKQHLDYSRLMAAAPGWKPLLDQTGATYALVLTDSPIAAALVERAGWNLLESDAGYSLLGASERATP